MAPEIFLLLALVMLVGVCAAAALRAPKAHGGVPAPGAWPSPDEGGGEVAAGDLEQAALRRRFEAASRLQLHVLHEVAAAERFVQEPTLESLFRPSRPVAVD
jgi:hypothetical protein